MDGSVIRVSLLIFVLSVFACVLVFQGNPEEASLEDIPLDVYDLIVQEHPDATKQEVLRIFLEDREMYMAFSESHRFSDR